MIPNVNGSLVQQYLFIPAKYKDVYFAFVLNEFAGKTAIVFVSTCATARRATYLLRNLGFGATCLHGQMSQPKRLGALNKFKAGEREILIATDVASRGLDIPAVDLVVNFDVPQNAKDYVHRVGRTARAGRAGRAVTCAYFISFHSCFCWCAAYLGHLRMCTDVTPSLLSSRYAVRRTDVSAHRKAHREEARIIPYGKGGGDGTPRESIRGTTPCGHADPRRG